jgi:hypothetical protein
MFTAFDEWLTMRVRGEKETVFTAFTRVIIHTSRID